MDEKNWSLFKNVKTVAYDQTVAKTDHFIIIHCIVNTL